MTQKIEAQNTPQSYSFFEISKLDHHKDVTHHKDIYPDQVYKEKQSV